MNKFNILIIEMTGSQELLRMHAILIVPNVSHITVMQLALYKIAFNFNTASAYIIE